MDPATSMVAGAALSAIFQRLLDTLAPPFLESLGLPFGVEKEAKRLKSTHTRIEKILTDAEERQIKGESVRLWLSDLKHIGYDAEDILDELECRAKIEEAPIQTRKRKLTDRFRVTHFFSRFSSKFELGSRIKKIRESLDEIDRENNQFHLKVIYGPRSEMLRMRPPTGSIVDESIVFGRQADKAKVVRLLTSDDSSASDSGIQVVPICGMGGVGKTTIAQLICKDERVTNYFDVSAWVYVSEDFDLIRLTKAIAEYVPRSDPRLTNLDAIQVSIQNALKGKKFFLVLDDVWNVNYNRWDALRAPLMVAGRGSRILVTTRSHRVSSMMGTVPTYSLQCLSDDDCWSIFKRLAFVEGDSDVHPELVMIGKEIIKKCNGLPLAVKTLGGLLRSKVNVVDWKSILQSEIWDLPEEGNDILPALRLSYHHLPAHLKRCFQFCSVFPKVLNFMVSEQFVWSWMALGFIQSEGSKDMEDIGKEYLADLVSRSLLYTEGSFFRMHDLIHDLARSFSGAEILEIGDRKSDKNAEKAELLREQEKVLIVKILAAKNKGRTKTERRKFESQGGNSSLVVSLVTELDVQHIVSSWTGIPVENISSNKSKRLLKMEEALCKRVIGQDKAIEAISFAIHRARVGLKDPKPPNRKLHILGTWSPVWTKQESPVWTNQRVTRELVEFKTWCCL